VLSLTEDPNYYSFYGLEQDRFTLHILNMNSPSKVRSIPLRVPVDAYAVDVDLSDDGHWVAVGYSANESAGVNVWNTQGPSFQPIAVAAYYVAGSDQRNPQLTNVALSADGTKLAAFDSANGFLNFWAFNTAKQVYDRINPQSNPQKVQNINFISGKFSGKSGRGLQYSPDGRWLVALTDTSKIYIYDAEKQAYFTEIALEKENLVGLLYSPDNKYLLGVTSGYSYCNDNPRQNCQPGAAIKRWKLGIKNPAPEVVFQSTTTDITALHVGNDGTTAIGDEAGYVRAWSPGDELKLVEDTYVHNGSVHSILAGGQDGKTILSASEDDATLLWKLLQENVVVAVVIKRISNTNTNVVQSTNGKELAIAGSNPKSPNGLVSLYSELQDLQDPKKLEPLSFNSGLGSLQEVALGNTWVAAGRTCEIGEKNYYLDIWSRDENKGTVPTSLQLGSEIGSLSFGLDEKYLAVAYNSGKLQLLETAGLTELPANLASTDPESCPQANPLSALPQSTLRELPNDLTFMNNLLFAQNGNHNYLIGASQQRVRIWNVDTFAIEADLYNATDPIRISFGPEQKWLATGSSENAIQGSFTSAIQLYELSNIHTSPTILPIGTTVTELAFSQDGQWLAAATKSREILIYKLLPTPQTLPSYTLTGFTKDISWLEFSPNASKVQWLAVSSGPKVFLYNMKNADGTPLSLAHASTANVNYVGFAKEGEWVVSAATDQTLWFWSLDPKTLSDTACAYAGRNLNPSERKRYLIDTPTCDYSMENPIALELDITPQPYPTAGVQLMPTFPPEVPIVSPPPIPTEPSITYTVKEGDTLTSIASQYGIDVNTLAADNGITNLNQIIIGQALRIRIRNTPAAP
jgi:WD40 repeat protein